MGFATVAGPAEIRTLPADGSVLAPQSLREPGLGVPHVWSAADELILTANPGDIFALPVAATEDLRPVVASTEYVEFDPEDLMGKLRRDVEAAINAGRMQDTQAGRLLRFYEEALMGYTYLEDPNAD